TMAHFPVIDREWADLGFAIGDGDVAGAVVAHQDYIIPVVHGVKLGEGASGAEGVQDLHGLHVLDFEFASHRNSAGGKKTGAEDDGTDGALVGGARGAAVE